MMLGSHNSFTSFPPVLWLYRLFTSLWKCQRLSPTAQYEKGVRFFDVRVIWNEKKSVWEVGHGLVVIKGPTFKSAHELSTYMSQWPGIKYRVVLERGTSVRRFKTEFLGLTAIDPALVALIIKDGWEIIYQSPMYPPKTDDKCCRLFNWNAWESVWWNLKHKTFKPGQTIPRWAKQNNPHLTPEQVEDKETLYFLDYVDI